MQGKYFNSSVIKPLVPASLQHAGVFTAGDVLFDWTSFEIPRGAARLIGATVLVRPKGDAAATPNVFGIDLLFHKDTAVSATPVSIGTVNSPGPVLPSNDIIGTLSIEADSFATGGATGAIAVGTTGSTDSCLVLGGNPNTGPNVSVDKYWVAGIAGGAHFFTSLNAIAEDTAASAAASQAITVDGTGMDCTESIMVGDILHTGTSEGETPENALIGTVSAVTARLITNEAVSPVLLVDGDIFYNINPIRIILHFEK
tara:strand:+ start:45 stop:815 length:771 start_codon:yes stop_codon:yes gene_type:complete